MPAKVVAGAVAMSTNASPQPFDLGNELLAAEAVEITIEILAGYS